MEKDMSSQISKKGVSVMIGYVLLVSIAIAMGGVMYAWMKSYVPSDSLECPRGVSLYLEDYYYNCTTSTLSLSIKNNGLFDLAGYYVYGSIDSTQSPAIDLSDNLVESSNGQDYGSAIILKVNNNNTFETGDSVIHAFNLLGISPLKKISLVGARWEEENRKNTLVNCGDESRIVENLVCAS